MNTLQQLNLYSNDPVFFIDKRLLNIVYAQGVPRDTASNQFLNIVHTLRDGAQIVEFEGEGECTYTLTVPTGATVDWSTMPVEIPRSIVGNVYTATISNGTQWQQLLAATRVTITTTGDKAFVQTLNYIEGKTFIERNYTWTITTTPVAWVNELETPINSFYGLRTTFPLLNAPRIGASSSDFQDFMFRLEIFSTTLNLTNATATGPATIVYESGRLKLTGTRDEINASLDSIRLTTDTEAIQNYTLSYQLFNLTVGLNGTKVQTLEPSGTAIMLFNGDGFFGTNSTFPLINPQQVGPRVTVFDDDGYTLKIDSTNLLLNNITSSGAGATGQWDAVSSSYIVTGSRDGINTHLNNMLITTGTATSANKTLRYTLTAIASGIPAVTTQTLTVPATTTFTVTEDSFYGFDSTWTLLNTGTVGEPVSQFDSGGYRLVLDSLDQTFTLITHTGILTPGVWDPVARTYTITGSRSEVNQHLTQLLISNTNTIGTGVKTIRYTLTALMKGFPDAPVVQNMSIPATAVMTGTGNTEWGRNSTWKIHNPRQVGAAVHPFDAGGYTVTLSSPDLDFVGNSEITYSGTREEVNAWLQTVQIPSSDSNSDPANKTLTYSLKSNMSGLSVDYTQNMVLPTILNLQPNPTTTYFGVGNTVPLLYTAEVNAQTDVRYSEYGYRLEIQSDDLNITNIAYVGTLLGDTTGTWDPILKKYTIEGTRGGITFHKANLSITTASNVTTSAKTMKYTWTSLMKGFPETTVNQIIEIVPQAATVTPALVPTYFGVGTNFPLIDLTALSGPTGIFDNLGYELKLDFNNLIVDDVQYVGPTMSLGEQAVFNLATQTYTISGLREDINRHLEYIRVTSDSSNTTANKTLTYTLTNKARGFAETAVNQTVTLPTVAVLSDPVLGSYIGGAPTIPTSSFAPNVSVSSTVFDSEGYTIRVSSPDLDFVGASSNNAGGTVSFDAVNQVYTITGNREQVNSRLGSLVLNAGVNVAGNKTLEYEFTVNMVGVPTVKSNTLTYIAGVTTTNINTDKYLPYTYGGPASSFSLSLNPAVTSSNLVLTVQPAIASRVSSLGVTTTAGVTSVYDSNLKRWTLTSSNLAALNTCLASLTIIKSVNTVSSIDLNFNFTNPYGSLSAQQIRTMTYDGVENVGVENFTVTRDFMEATLVNSLFDTAPLPTLLYPNDFPDTIYEFRITPYSPAFNGVSVGEIYDSRDGSVSPGWSDAANAYSLFGTKAEINAAMSNIKFRPNKFGSTRTDLGLVIFVWESGFFRAGQTCALTRLTRTTPLPGVQTYTVTTGSTGPISIAAETLKYANVTMKLVGKGGDSYYNTSSAFQGGGGAGGFLEYTNLPLEIIGGQPVNNTLPISMDLINQGVGATISISIEANGDALMNLTSPTTASYRALAGGLGGNNNTSNPVTPGPGNGVSGGSGGGAGQGAVGRVPGAGTAGQGFAGGTNGGAFSWSTGRGGGGGGCRSAGLSGGVGGGFSNNGGNGTRRRIAGVDDCWISWGGSGRGGDYVSAGTGFPAYGLGGAAQASENGATPPATVNSRFGIAGVAEIEITAP